MLIDRSGLDTVLIGGKDEKQLGEHLAAKAGSGCTNLCGRLSLAQTAAVLKSCNLVISGDTGPAHVAVAVGTPVLGIYGPTFPNRSGPYGPLNQVCDRSHQCRCHNLKRCKLLTTPGPGRCMQGITAGEVHTLAANLLATG